MPGVAAQEALDRLREGNRRFVSGGCRAAAADSRLRRERLLSDQAPFAVVLGCSDSRVPVEIVFDQALGDLFVVRVAGQVAAPSQIGSIEFAVERLGARLVVVLGHSRCGAVRATLEELRRPARALSPYLRAIVDQIRPSVEDLLATDPEADPETLVQKAVRAHVAASVMRLRRESETLVQLGRSAGLLVAGAQYQLESGVVDFFDDAHDVVTAGDEPAGDA
jgi:carbonic anhydrase